MTRTGSPDDCTFSASDLRQRHRAKKQRGSKTSQSTSYRWKRARFRRHARTTIRTPENGSPTLARRRLPIQLLFAIRVRYVGRRRSLSHKKWRGRGGVLCVAEERIWRTFTFWSVDRRRGKRMDRFLGKARRGCVWDGDRRWSGDWIIFGVGFADQSVPRTSRRSAVR